MGGFLPFADELPPSAWLTDSGTFLDVEIST